MSPLRVSYTAVIGVMLGAACGGGDGTPPGPTATQIAKNGGDNQVAAAGTALTPLSVIVRDANNAPVQGVTVNWATGGGGSVSAATSQTDASGIATITRTLGPNAGAQTTIASKAGLTGSPLNFAAVAQIQGATQMSLSAGTGQTDTVLATLGTPLAVLVRDQNNTPVAGVVVNWSATGGSVASPTSTSNGSGIASVNYTLGSTAGSSQTAQASVTGLSGSPVSFSATANAGNAFTIVKTAGDGGSGAVNTMVTYTVTARDNHSNPKSGVVIDWAATGGGGTISPPQNTTGTNGQASAQRTLSANLGAHTATATASVIPQTVTFTTTAVAATASVTVGPGGTNSFSPTPLNISNGTTVTWTWASGIHTIDWDTGPAPLPPNQPSTNAGPYVHTFTQTGTYNYHCANHLGMNGTVVVN